MAIVWLKGHIFIINIGISNANLVRSVVCTVLPRRGVGLRVRPQALGNGCQQRSIIGCTSNRIGLQFTTMVVLCLEAGV